MRITFLKVTGEKDLYLYGNTGWNDENRAVIPELETMLKEKFPSIKFINRKNGIFRQFRFKNKADEAHFLLWSSNETMVL